MKLRITINIDEKLLNKMKAKKVRTGLPISWQVEDALSNYCRGI